jgi:hypothetical protein
VSEPNDVLASLIAEADSRGAVRGLAWLGVSTILALSRAWRCAMTTRRCTVG